MDSKNQKPHGKDLRKGRYSHNNQIYLITTVTQHRQIIFTNFNLARIVVNAMRNQHLQQNVSSLAFVIMPDHFHWLFSLQNNCTLADIMHSVKGRSARQRQQICRNRNELEEGQVLWQKGYHDHAIRQEEDIQKIARYIVANPLRAGIVTNIANYPLWDAIWL